MEGSWMSAGHHRVDLDWVSIQAGVQGCGSLGVGTLCIHQFRNLYWRAAFLDYSSFDCHVGDAFGASLAQLVCKLCPNDLLVLTNLSFAGIATDVRLSGHAERVLKTRNP